MESKALLAIALWLCVETRAASGGKQPKCPNWSIGHCRVRAERWGCGVDLGVESQGVVMRSGLQDEPQNLLARRCP